MRRLAAIVVLLVAAAVTLVFAGGAGSGPEPYRVRAIFDNAFSLYPGEEVKIAGVKVGTISELDVTPDNKAAVVLDIVRPGFQDFRRDAHCTIRPQSMIGEKFVECTPTQPRAADAPAAAPLAKIPKGQPGAGQHLLPVENTSKPIDIDLVNDVLDRPYRERLPLILNELGVGLAANGRNLHDAIRRANPALMQTDAVLRILGSQNEVIAGLVRDSDRIMAPLAQRRVNVGDFIAKANTTAEATVARSADLERTFQRLPELLRQLKPTMARLGGMADQMTPALADLHAVAPQVNRFISEMGPFARAATPALTSLGDAADVGRVTLTKARSVVADLRSFANAARPLSDNLAALLGSLKESGGIERILDYMFFQMTAINGFDSIGHYLRAGLIVNTCSTYAIKRVTACSANFDGAAARIASAAADDAGRTPELVAMDRVLRGLSPTPPSDAKAPDAGAGPQAGQGGATGGPIATGDGSPAGGGRQAPKSNRHDGVSGLLDYLLGT